MKKAAEDKKKNTERDLKKQLKCLIELADERAQQSKRSRPAYLTAPAENVAQA
jgi:hypothetical protein